MQLQPLNNPLPPSAQAPSFADSSAEAAWRLECRRATERTGPRYFVNPRCRFKAAFGDTWLNPGDTVEMYTHFTPQQIQDLVVRGLVGLGTPEGALVEATPADARYVVADGNSITSSHGVRPAKAEIRPEWLSGKAEALVELVRTGRVLDRHAHLQPAHVALRERQTELEQAVAARELAALQLGTDNRPEAQAAFLAARDAVDVAVCLHAHALKIAGGSQ